MNSLKDYWQSMSPADRAKTLKALRASIKHWKRHETGKAKPGEGVFDDDCDLCKTLRNYSLSPECAACPVFAKTGKDTCEGSPWSKTDYYFRGRGQTQPKRFRQAASRMRAFLESLRPERETKQTK